MGNGQGFRRPRKFQNRPQETAAARAARKKKQGDLNKTREGGKRPPKR